MATGQRVPQDEKRIHSFKTVYAEVDLVYREDGRTIERTTLTEGIERVPTTEYVSQPDRIRLDLSVQEAETLLLTGALIGGLPSGRRGHWTAVNEALAAAGITFGCDAGGPSYESAINRNVKAQGLSGQSIRFLHSEVLPLILTPSLGGEVSSNAGTTAPSQKDSAKDSQAPCYYKPYPGYAAGCGPAALNYRQ